MAAAMTVRHDSPARSGYDLSRMPTLQHGVVDVFSAVALRVGLSHLATWGDVGREPHIAANDATAAQGDPAQNCGTGINDNAIFTYGVTGQALLQAAVFSSGKALGS